MIRGLLVRGGRGIAHHRVWAAVAVIALAGGGTVLHLVTGSSASTSSTATSYRAVSAALGTVRQSVSTTGTLEPASQESLSFQVSGKVTSVRVAEGDKVKKGQVLATVNSAALKASVAQAKASLANAQASLVSAEDADATDAQLSADKASVTAAKQSVSSARDALVDAKLTSPITGQVASADLAVGDQVSGSGSGSGTGSAAGAGDGNSAASTSGSSSSSAQFLVISTTKWTVTSSVDATEVGLITKGDQAQLTIDGATGTVYGTISSIGVIASSSSSSGSSSSTASYPVDVAVTGNPSGLHAGTSATVALIYQQLTNVLTVPSLAVSQVNGTSVVYVSSNGTATGKRVMTKVATGLSSDGTVQITSGLTTGKVVLVAIPGQLNRGTTTARTGTRGGEGGGFGGGGTGNFPGGGTGNFPGGTGNIPGGTGNFGGGGR